MKTPGQIVHGAVRARTRIAIEPDLFGEGVFVAKTGGPGPILRDFSVSFVQPDTDDRAKLICYPPAFFARDTPGFEMEHPGCYVATARIDMKGDSGGATVANLQMSAFEIGIDIDGSLDTVRITDPHWWPSSLSKGQQTIFMDQGPQRAIALDARRVDNLVVRGGLFLGGLAIHLSKGASGGTFGSINGTDFDTTSGIAIEADTLQIAAAVFTRGLTDVQSIVQSGGTISLASCVICAGTALTKPAVALSGGILSVKSSQFDGNGFDVSALVESGLSVLTLTGNLSSRAPGLPYRYPALDLELGRIIATGNHATDKGAHAGTFIRVGKDDPSDRIVGNSSPGWANMLPSQRKGIYLFE